MISKRSIKIFTSLMAILMIVGTIVIPSYANEPFEIKAKSAILIDAGTGKILYEKNSHEQLRPASITKIMVLLLAMESIDSGKIKLNDEVLVSENASGMGGSQVFLEAGELITIESLLRAIAVRSGNDAALALGEHIAGTEEIFIKMMNDKAKELGMKNTHFVNCTGLDDDNHYSSAYDITIMSRELLKHPKIHNWLSLYMTSIMVGKDKDVQQNLVNTNKLVRFYNGANGIKTGYTSKSGHCLSASATRGNLTLISVVLGCESSSIRFNESRKLLDYGFANYDSIPIYKKGDIITNLPVNKGKVVNANIIIEDDLKILVKKGTENKVEKEIKLPKYIDSPMKKNDKIGEIIVKIDGIKVGRVNLILQNDIEKANIFIIMKRMFKNLMIK